MTRRLACWPAMRRASLVTLVAGLLAACGGGTTPDDASAPPSTPRTAAPATTDAPAPTTTAPPPPRGVRLVGIGRFNSPLYVTAPPGDRHRIFVVQQGGRIMVVRDDHKLARPFLDITPQVTSGGEQGLLSLAFAPDYARSGRFYVYFTDRGQQERIVEYRRASADRADPGSARLVLRMADPEPNHNGGLMIFGRDGLMYVGTGDGGGGYDQHGARGNAQSLGSLLGKILRIDPRASGGRPYTVPTTNPFAQRAGARPEVYAYGLRNPWRFSFDRLTDDLTIGDVGQDAVEEIDFVRRGRGAGANFGWRPFEGTRRNFDEPAPRAIAPVIQQLHSEGFCSITGGYVVRDRTVPGLYDRYLYGDFCEGRVRAATLRAGRMTEGRVVDLRGVPSLSSFGEDAVGHVYVTSLQGPVYRFAAR
jgi:glucose/arabinose dehydrogenase